MCAHECVSACVVFSLSHLQLALSWQASPLPLPVLNGAQRERACDSPFPSSPCSCSALPWVCKQICAHVTSRFASQLSSPSALPRWLCPPICRQKEGRMRQTLTNGAPASMLMCVCVCACVSVCTHPCACICERETRETFAAKSRQALVSSMRMADVLTTKTKPFVWSRGQRKKTWRNLKSPFPSFAHTQILFLGGRLSRLVCVIYI